MSGPRNWAGNVRYQARRIYFPQSVEEAVDIVKGARHKKLRALGTRHTFNSIADSPDALVSLEHLKRVKRIDFGPNQEAVTVEAGISYGELGKFLHARDLALRNLASLPHISVAGAAATATHGSGDKIPCLAADVIGLKFIAADGTLHTLTRKESEDFPGAVVALGALGLVVELTLRAEPTFQVAQQVYEKLPFSAIDHFDDITASGDSVSLFTDWQTSINQVWIKRRVGANDRLIWEPDLHGAKRVTDRRHPVDGISAENCTEQRGIPGPWHERLPHFRFEFNPSVGDELHTEYFVPRAKALDAFHIIRGMSSDLVGLLWISEIRTVAPDELWMSPFYKQSGSGDGFVAFHFTWKMNPSAVAALLPKLEEKLKDCEARPHWGKLFHMRHERLRDLYADRLDKFGALLKRYDPEGKFRNAFVDECLGPIPAS